MPEEVFIIIALAIVAGTFTSVVKMILAYMEGRSTRSKKVQDSSLTTSQLQNLIEEAVHNATEPLAKSLDRLERRLERIPAQESPKLNPTQQPGLLDDADGYLAEDLQPAKQRNRTVA